MKKITFFSIILVFFFSLLNAQNQMQFNQLSMIDAYSQIPIGQNKALKFKALFLNNGSVIQNNIKLHVKELTTLTEIVSSSLPSLSPSNIDSLNADSIILPSIAGNYYIIAWLSSNSLTQVLYSDTFKITINNNNVFARDNNTYTGSRWAGTTGSVSNPYIATSKINVKTPTLAISINFVVSSDTKVGSKVKAILYRDSSNYSNFIVKKAISNNYFLTPIDIPVSSGQNPVSITLAFTNPYLLSPDTTYRIGIQFDGGTDTVKIATDNTSIPQDPQDLIYFAPDQNYWYIWAYGPAPAVMIRLNAATLPYVEDYNKTSLIVFPVPASSILNIDFGDWKINNASLIIYSISGIEVLKQDLQTSNKTHQIDISKLPKGMYFLKVNDNKQAVVKKFIKE